MCVCVCAMYIPPESSTSHKCDPFDILEHKIVDCSRHGNIVLLGDTYARTRT